MRKKFILFDHDGVLVHTEPWYFEATRLCIAELGFELPLDRYLEDMKSGRTAWDQPREAGVPEHVVVAARQLRDVRYQQFLQSEDIEIPNVINILGELSQTYRMAIVTTAKPEDFALIHRRRHIVEAMDFVLANGDYPRAKPAPDPYVAALARFDCRPEEAVVVEDSERGLRSAVAAGIDCVIVRNEFIRGHDFSSATAVLDHLGDLPHYLIG